MLSQKYNQTNWKRPSACFILLQYYPKQNALQEINFQMDIKKIRKRNALPETQS